MIISASYKTDLPTFYAPWFLNRLRAGYCKTVNPYGGQIYTIDLRPDAVDGFVFWTKNVGPFLPALHEVHSRGHPFILQYAINGYPRELEHAVTDAARSIDHARHIAATYGPRVIVWRYDPIVFSSLTPPEFHERNFARLAAALEGATDEVVISFAQIYRKTLRNMTAAARESNFTWLDPPDEQKQSLAARLTQIAAAHRIQLTVCSQRTYVVPGAAEARCVDARRLEDIARRPISAKPRGNRPDCACHASRDIGAYDTCPHGCVYCYAVTNRPLAQRRYRHHDPNGEFLFPPP